MAQSNQERKRSSSPYPLKKDPTVPTVSVPTTSKEVHTNGAGVIHPPKCNKFKNYLYDSSNNTFCERTCTNWALIIGYGFMYIIFLCTYSLVFLYISLWIIRYTEVYNNTDNEVVQLSKFKQSRIGLSATPVSEAGYPVILYRQTRSNDQQKYVNAIDNLMEKKRRKRDLNLGPCGVNPYGYGDSPCIIIRVNKRFNWAGKPLEANSTETKMAPPEVQYWVKRDKMLWLYCQGMYPHDKEHVGRIKYYPHPPGIDPKLFPVNKDTSLPLIAVQISNFTLGITLHIECKLWYVSGPSMIDFMLYVVPDDRPIG